MWVERRSVWCEHTTFVTRKNRSDGVLLPPTRIVNELVSKTVTHTPEKGYSCKYVTIEVVFVCVDPCWQNPYSDKYGNAEDVNIV